MGDYTELVCEAATAAIEAQAKRIAELEQELEFSRKTNLDVYDRVRAVEQERDELKARASRICPWCDVPEHETSKGESDE